MNKIKVLWITNTIFPAPSIKLGFNPPVVGGWMYGLANKLSTSADVNLAVATLYSGVDFKTMIIDGVTYYLLPRNGNLYEYPKYLEKFWLMVCSDFKPDLIHIHGTEYSHGLACMRSFEDVRYVISIQGLVGVCARYYFAGISFYDLLKNITFRDILRFDTIFQAKNKFEKRGLFEREYFYRTQHVIGRTSWDYSHTKAINRSILYHFCDETLRERFYESRKWNLQEKSEYTIFLSQASYPIKGLHQVLKAVAILKGEFPKIKVRVAGDTIIKTTNLIDKIKLSGYGKYIEKLIKQHNLDDNVVMLGVLNEEQMIAEYLNTHIFICPSSIENSPNSLGEAQLLGVPVVASYVGGIPDMVQHGETGLLYRFEEVEVLAELIKSIFIDDGKAEYLSRNSIKNAAHRHDPLMNVNSIKSIYYNILS